MRVALTLSLGLVAALALSGCKDSDKGSDGGILFCNEGTCPEGQTCVSEGSLKVCKPNSALDGSVTTDGKTGDSKAGDLTYTDGTVTFDCTGKTNGTDCSQIGTKGFICLASECRASTCGDSYVDSATNEECDDGNDVADDGCNACKYSCHEDSDCDDKNACTGTETCDKTTTHKCVAGTPPAPDTVDCTLEGGGNGKCRGGACAKAGCGDHDVDAGEDCDDGNTTPNDGCESDCTYSCTQDADCSNGDKCDGEETCNTTTHICANGAAPNCNDNDTCTVDSCDAATGCVNTRQDTDKDGHLCGPDDCNDADPSIYKDAPECNDTKDNDCDGDKDEAPLAAGQCWADPDKDGYAAVTAEEKPVCPCPEGYTSRQPVEADLTTWDCAAGIADVHPGQTQWYTKDYCKSQICTIGAIGSCFCKLGAASWDYNCSGAPEKQYNSLAPAGGCKLSDITKRCTGSGWVETAVPDCGATATYRTCKTLYPSTKYGIISCSTSEEERPQGCH